MSEMPLTSPAPPANPPAPTAPSSRSVLGWVLIILGVLFLLGTLLPAVGDWLGPAVLAAGGVVLLGLYAGGRARHAWLVIAGGSLLSLAAVSAWNLYSETGGGAILFSGLAVTFGVFALLQSPASGRRWAVWAAAGCLVVAILATGLSWAWPLVLIGAGVWLLVYRGVAASG